mgnify:CR=1 FL=1
MQTPLDYLLAYHCAPALAGIKSASLVSCDQTRYPNLPAQIERYNRVLNPRGLRFRILCACGGSRLLLVYRETCLERALSAPRAQAMLQAAGYPVGMPAELLLDTLAARLRERDGFPHEIGLFLGYPAEDVYGFLKYGGKNCKYTGCWKVYSDVDRALALFDRYRRCRSALCRRVSNGDSIIQMFCPS